MGVKIIGPPDDNSEGCALAGCLLMGALTVLFVIVKVLG
jgi:hypothetical protein